MDPHVIWTAFRFGYNRCRPEPSGLTMYALVGAAADCVGAPIWRRNTILPSGVQVGLKVIHEVGLTAWLLAPSALATSMVPVE